MCSCKLTFISTKGYGKLGQLENPEKLLMAIPGPLQIQWFYFLKLCITRRQLLIFD